VKTTKKWLTETFRWIQRIFTDDKGNPSTIRIAVAVYTMITYMLLRAMYRYIVTQIEIKGTIDWYGLTAFLGAISSFVGLVLWQKVKQKDIEKDYHQNRFYNNKTKEENGTEQQEGDTTERFK